MRLFRCRCLVPWFQPHRTLGMCNCKLWWSSFHGIMLPIPQWMVYRRLVRSMHAQIPVIEARIDV